MVDGIAAKAKPVSPEAIRKWEFANEILPHLRATQLPYPYFARVKNWHSLQRKAYEQVKACLTGKGAIVALVGPRGLGKTTIAAQLILDRAWNPDLLPQHRRPPYRKASQFIQKFKALYSDFGVRDNEALMDHFTRYCRDHPLFIIDEWSEAGADDLKAHGRMMTDFLDRRYSLNNDTLLISNQTPEDFMDSTNESTLSRMDESGSLIHCDWPSFRSQ